MCNAIPMDCVSQLTRAMRSRVPLFAHPLPTSHTCFSWDLTPRQTTPQVMVSSLGFEVDFKLRGLLSLLNEHGFATSNSCQDNHGHLWVEFCDLQCLAGEGLRRLGGCKGGWGMGAKKRMSGHREGVFGRTVAG